MMQVRVVRVAMRQPDMAVAMRVRGARRIGGIVRVLVMRIVQMRMLMFQCLVRMFVLMPLADMEP